MHVTSDDLFISMEMNFRNEERGKVEKERKIRQQLQATEEKAKRLLRYWSKVSQLIC
jgi:hypothetical protein